MRKILVIDDDRIIIYSVIYYLKRNGFEGVSCTDPHSVESSIKEHKPDALIMDIFMNGEDGREICRRLKNSDLKTLPIILYSVDKFAREEVLAYGANEFLQKPLEEDKLIEALDYVMKLETARQSRYLRRTIEKH